MLKLGEKIIYESSNNFELGSFAKLQLGDKKVYLTNLGNIIIEDNTNFLKKEATKYEYVYSQYKQKLKLKIENDIILLFHENLIFNITSNEKKNDVVYKFSLKLSFEDFKMVCENQREFIGEFGENQGIIRLDNNKLILSNITNEEDKFKINSDGFDEIVEFTDIERCYIMGNNLKISGYFYIKNTDEIIRDIYIYSNNKNLYKNIDKITSQNRKIGRLPDNCLICYGKVHGNIKDKDYKNTEVFIIKNNREIKFIHKQLKEEILSMNYNSLSKLSLGSTIALFDEENLITISTGDKSINLLDLTSLKNIKNKNIGFTSNDMPFFILQNETYLNLFKSPKRVLLSIQNSHIKDIIIDNQIKSNHEDFTKVEILFESNKITVNLRNEIIPKLIKNVFIYSKKNLLQRVSIKDIYMNWAKSVNDMILLNFFGNIYYMKEEIDNITNKNMTDEDRVNIVNMLFYQIQEQRNQFDILSAYMPKAIEYGEVDLFKKCNVQIDNRVFRLLQRQLFNISSQINRHLSDIERSLSQLSFVIYSDFNTREYNTKLKSKQAKIGMAVSVANSLLAGSAIAIPFIAMQGMNLYTTKKMDEKAKEIESSKLKLFTNQAILKLHHLIDDMYPYYISEANYSLFDLFNKLGKQYEKLGDESIKEIIIDRIADIYVAKQMTLNSFTNIRKKDLIEKLYKTIDSNMNSYDTNMFLLGGIE